MGELQIINLENTDVVGWDFDMLKMQLSQKLEYYKNLVYTEDDIKSAKNDRSDLNKAKKIIEDARKKYKSKCLEPYEALEPRIKELVSMIEDQRTLIDETVKAYEDKKKNEKENAIRAYYDKKSFELGEYADKLFTKLLDSKWLNASTNKNTYEEGILIAINKAINDINNIKALNSPFFDTLMNEYISTLSMESVEYKNNELIEASNKAGLTEKSDINDISPEKIVNYNNNQNSNGNGETILKIQASDSQMNQILDFMKVIGVSYEIM